MVHIYQICCCEIHSHWRKKNEIGKRIFKESNDAYRNSVHAIPCCTVDTHMKCLAQVIHQLCQGGASYACLPAWADCFSVGIFCKLLSLQSSATKYLSNISQSCYVTAAAELPSSHYHHNHHQQHCSQQQPAAAADWPALLPYVTRNWTSQSA